MQTEPQPITHRSVLAIAVPMTIGYLTVPLVGMVDMAVVGQTGVAAAIGGVALASVLFDVLFTTFNFLRSGTTGLVAQAVGRRDGLEQQAVVWRAIAIAAAIGAAILLLRGPILDLGLRFLGGSGEVQAATRRYFDIRVLSAPAALINFAVFGWLLGLGRATVGLLLQTLLNAINIGLALWLGLWLGYGLEGVAWGAVVAELVALAAGLAVVVADARSKGWPRPGLILDPAKLKAMLGVNRDIMIRSFVLLAAFFYFVAQSARFGDVTLAANAILEKFFLTAAYFLDGFAAAAETFVGRAVGARHRPSFDGAVRLTAIWGYAMAAIAGVVMFAGGEALVAVMTTAPEVRAVAAVFLPYAALTPLMGVSAFQMDGIFIGATWSRDMRNMMLASIAIYFALWYALGLILGNHGLWIALLGFLGARGLSLWLIMGRRADATFPA